jgi:single-strand DNA-binding protein
MVNKVILVGNLGADPESRATTSGTAVVNLSLATNERKKNSDGEWVDHTEWHKVTVFGKTAENVAKYCKKGKTIFVEGKIQTRKWQDKEGVDRYTTEVLANDVRFLGGGKSESGSSGEASSSASSATSSNNDDIPF